MEDLYGSIFKRKSFHLYRNIDSITPQELEALRRFIDGVEPLDQGIKTRIEIVPEKETTCRRGAEICILFYSEKKGDYLRNIGYIGEQIDLYLASQGIGALWFGIGRPKQAPKEGLEYVIMIALAKMPDSQFRKDMFRAKRKPLEDIWSGDPLGVAGIARFAPSACNMQPWKMKNSGGILSVYRYRDPKKRGIMPAGKVVFYNRIDLGILLLILETCLRHEGIAFTRKLYEDPGEGSGEMVLNAEYRLDLPQ